MPVTLPYFLYSAGIFFREGLEALLVIIALTAGVRQLGQSYRTRHIYAGAFAAVVVSAVMAWTVNEMLGDNAGDALEGAFQLTAAGTLFYVSSWLTGKAQANRWRDFIGNRLRKANRSPLPSFALALTAFLAVAREGGETIVFFQALLAGATEAAEKHAVMAGVLVASAGLIGTFLILERAMERIPLRSFFRTTSALLYLLAIVFVGQGIASWQEAGLIGATFIPHAPTFEALGLFPTYQTLVPQILLTLGAGVALAWRAIPATSATDAGKPRPADSIGATVAEDPTTPALSA